MSKIVEANILEKKYLNFLSAQEILSEPFYNKLGQLKNFYLPICEKIFQSYKKNKKIINKNFFLIISDFYYEDSANTLKDELIKKIDIKNISVKKINDKKYRVFVGPFENFNALKTTYISLNKLGFEDLNIYKN